MKNFNIKKKNGENRLIFSCDKIEKRNLRRINSLILSPIQNKYCKHAHAYITGKNTYTNALLHVDKKVTITLDLKDFFEHITIQKIFECNLFKTKIEHLNKILFAFNKEKKENYDIYQLVKDYCLVGKSTSNKFAGQGLPTSPALANIIFDKVDNQIVETLKELSAEIVYSRYSDDLAISTNIEEKEFSAQIIEKISHIINENNFKINFDKTKIMTKKHGNRIICGLSVDKDVFLPKIIRKKLRALEHNSLKDEKSIKAKNDLKNYIDNILTPLDKFSDEDIEKLAELLVNSESRNDNNDDWSANYLLVFALLKGKAGGKSITKKVFDLVWLKRRKSILPSSILPF